MAIYKRGNVYWYAFTFDGVRVQRSTKQGNRNAATDLEAIYRTELAKAAVGIKPPEPEPEPVSIPTLADFCDRVEVWAKAKFESTTPKNFLWFRTGIRALKLFKPLAECPLDNIRGELISRFTAEKLKEDYAISSVNSYVRVLRRVLSLAVEWDVLETSPKIKVLSGESHRDRVVASEEMTRYLAAAPEPLRSVATVLTDTGARPEEVFRLRWESITWANGRHGTLLVTHGKTASARRMIPLTPRVRTVLETKWDVAGKPEEGWVWDAPTRSHHIEPSSLRKQHAKTFEIIAKRAVEQNQKPVRPFVLYSLRHTFLTRLGESGCDVWTLARIAGHSSIAISSRYVHPSDALVLKAMAGVTSAETRLARRRSRKKPTTILTTVPLQIEGKAVSC